jgi:hypothetical protein
MIKVFSLILIVLAFNSCKPDDSYDANYDGDKLVLNGLIDTNIGVSVDLSKSQSPGGIIPNDGYKVKNGRVWLYQNDTLVAEMTIDAKGKYTVKNFRPQAGKSYRLKATADNLDSIESLPVVVPDLPVLTAYNFKKDSSYAINKEKAAGLCSITLKDKAKERNFYALECYVQIRADSTECYLAGPVLNLSSCEFGSSCFMLFTDKCFDGTTFSFDYFSEHTNKGTMKFELSSIDKNYYEYIRTFDQPKGFELAFVEPKIVVSNIKNGYGIVVAKSTRTFSFKLD